MNVKLHLLTERSRLSDDAPTKSPKADAYMFWYWKREYWDCTKLYLTLIPICTFVLP